VPPVMRVNESVFFCNVKVKRTEGSECNIKSKVGSVRVSRSDLSYSSLDENVSSRSPDPRVCTFPRSSQTKLSPCLFCLRLL